MAYNISGDTHLILAYCCTTECLTTFLDKLAKLIELSYKVKRKPLLVMLQELLPDSLATGLSIFKSDDNTNPNDEAIVSYIKELSNALKEVSVFNIELAFQPSEEFLTRLYTSIYDMVGNSIILDIGMARDALGGCIITYGGIYRNLSLLSYIDNYFAQNKHYVQELL